MINSIKREDKLLTTIEQLDFDYINKIEFVNEAKKIFNNNRKTIGIISSCDVIEDTSELDEYFLIIYDPSKQYDKTKILNEIKLKIDSDKTCINNMKIMYLIEIFSSIKESYDIDEVESNRIIDLRKGTKEKIKESKSSFSLTNIKYVSYVIPNEIKSNEKLEIKIKDRIRSLEQEYILNPDEKSERIKSYVFTAEIDSLIDLYNVFGDDLFDKNVRVGGIDDYMGVDEAIKKTYLLAPEEFWFLNNGVSLLIESNKSIDTSVFDRIKLDIDNIEDISVINGAQTIKAVSSVRYKKHKKEYNAYILLRIYIYENCGTKKEVKRFRDFSEKVTISLNKQKPISQTDLAYMTNFVKNMQIIKKTFNGDEKYEKFTFDFARRGEVASTVLCQYQLDTFAKIVKAYLLREPGQARSQSYSTLLKIDSSNNNIPKLADNNIFKDCFQGILDEENIEEYKTNFLKYYSPVNFAIKLKKYLEEFDEGNNGSRQSKFVCMIESYIKVNESELKEKDKKRLNSFGKYGTLVIISLTILMLNEFKEDFSYWEYSKLISNEKNTNEDEITIEKLEEMISSILEEFVKIQSEEESYDSNYWKKDSITKELIKMLKKKYNLE